MTQTTTEKKKHQAFLSELSFFLLPWFQVSGVQGLQFMGFQGVCKGNGFCVNFFSGGLFHRAGDGEVCTFRQTDIGKGP